MQREVRDFIEFLLGKLKRRPVAREKLKIQEQESGTSSEEDGDYINDFDWDEEEDEEGVASFD